MENHMPNIISIAFDQRTLRAGGVDHQLYQDKLIAALPNHKLQFSIARDIPQSLGMPLALSIVGGADAHEAHEAARQIWPTVLNTAMMSTSTQPDVVSVLGEQIRVGHFTVSRNGDETWRLERVREIYKVDGNAITFGLGPIGHASRTVLKHEKVAVTRESVTSVGI